MGEFSFPSISANQNRSKSLLDNTITCPDGKIVTALVTDEECPNGKFVNGVCVEDDDIVDNTKSPCVSEIIKELQKKDTKGALVPDLKGKTHLSQMILDLFGECQNYDLIIDVRELGNDSNRNPKNAETDGIKSITLDDDLVRQATQLSIAKTLIHESLHAFINLQMKNNRQSTLYSNIVEYYNEFKNEYTSNSVANNLTQHKFMSQFVEASAYSLSVYDNHRQNISYYTAMSWGGLESSDAYKKLNNKIEIQNIIRNERDAKNSAKGNKCP